MPDVTLTASSVAALVAGSSVFAALVTQGVTALREWWQSERDAGLSALYLAIALESYANDCASIIGESETFEASGGHAGTAHGGIAALPDFPAAVDWKAFGLRRSAEALSFRVEVETVRAMITDRWDVAGDEDFVVPEVREQTVKLGQKTLTLAREFRQAWKIAPLDYGANWHIGNFLDEKAAGYRTKRLDREMRQTASLDELNAAA